VAVNEEEEPHTAELAFIKTVVHQHPTLELIPTLLLD
jgi:hypothetical protein